MGGEEASSSSSSFSVFLPPLFTPSFLLVGRGREGVSPPPHHTTVSPLTGAASIATHTEFSPEEKGTEVSERGKNWKDKKCK